jgi:hypothetical protein
MTGCIPLTHNSNPRVYPERHSKGEHGKLDRSNGYQRKQTEKLGVKIFEMNKRSDDLRFVFDKPLDNSFDLNCLKSAFVSTILLRAPGGSLTRQVLISMQSLQLKLSDR